MKNRTIQFYDPVYHVQYTAVVGSSEDFKKVLQRKYPDKIVGNESARCLFKSKPNRECYIYLNRLDVSALSHECVHAAIDVFHDIGSRVTLETDENFAYYVQWLVGTIYYGIKNHK